MKESQGERFMSDKRLRVLVISELFPNPSYPAFGIFIERQTHHLRIYCDSIVVAPVRVFPHLRLWKYALNPGRFFAEWKRWRIDLTSIPQKSEVNGIPVYYPHYTSPPKQIFHGTWGFFAYLFLRRQLLALHQQHSFDLIHAHYASPCGVIALLAKRWMRVPVVLSIHGSDLTYTVRQNRLSATIIRWVFNKVDTIIANSTWTKEQIVRYGGDPEKVQIIRYGGDPEKVQIVHLGGNPPEAIPPTNSPMARDAIILLSVGYLEERKGHTFMLQAVKRLRNEGYDLRYVIVGDGSQRQSLQAMVETLGIADIVSFEGYKSHSEVWNYFSGCDIFALPSWNEAFGVVYIEALSQGKPVIGCEGEGGPEDLKALGDCIELVKPQNVESLVMALRRLIDDPERRRQMGEIGRRIIAEHFTWQQNAANTWAIYQRALKAHHA